MNYKFFKVVVGLLLTFFLSFSLFASSDEPLFDKQTFTEYDSILVVEEGVGEIKAWQASKSLIPASLIKLNTAYLAIDKWGVDHAFQTEFYRYQNQLWVKGYGDPYLVSEELDLVVDRLRQFDLSGVDSLYIDDSYFLEEAVPGRSNVNDPYNAPLSAVAANFNTVMLKSDKGEIQSAEQQTPLTKTAIKLAKQNQLGVSKKGKAQRINLINRDNAQLHFAQLLIAKLEKQDWQLTVNGEMPEKAQLIYRHTNSKTVAQIIQGMLEFSNNFMANQLFLNLSSTPHSELVSFKASSAYAQNHLKAAFQWLEFCIVEGSGLSRNNQLSARQIDDLLVELKPYKHLFKKVKNNKADIFAKTGTLDGVRTFAGYIKLRGKDYRFVFMFNRKVPWQYREKLLETLVEQLVSRQQQSNKILPVNQRN